MSTGVDTAGPVPPVTRHRRDTSGMVKSDVDRLYETVQLLAEKVDQNTRAVATLAEGFKSHDERIKRVEQLPGQEASALRGNLGLAIAAGGGCIIPMATFGGGTIVAIIGSLIGLLLAKGVL